MGRRRKWLSKVKKALGSRHRKLPCAKHGEVAENVLASRRLEPEPDMLVTRTADEDTTVDIPWSILEEPYVDVVTPAVQNASKVMEVGSEERENASVEDVGVTELTRFGGQLDEEAVAVRIQTAIRKYLAKRKLRELRGMVRLKALMQWSSTKRQTAATLQCMQTLSRVQSQIRARRIIMSEENQALQRQLQQKHEKDMEKMKLTVIGDDWNDSTKTKEKLEASLRHRQEALMRRERALAYARSFQLKWRNGLKVANLVYIDPVNPHWGWNWVERWMAERPWDITTAIDQPVRPLSVDEISKAYYAHCDRHPDTTIKPPLLIPQRPSRISIRPPPRTPSTPSNAKRLKSPRCKSGDSGSEEDSNSKTICSVQTCKQQRRHSIASPSMSHPISPRTMASAEAHKARLQKSSSSSTGSAKKSLPTHSPILSAARRHSGPPKVDLSSIKNTSLRS